jgi:hypothetical protein
LFSFDFSFECGEFPPGENMELTRAIKSELQSDIVTVHLNRPWRNPQPVRALVRRVALSDMLKDFGLSCGKFSFFSGCHVYYVS